MKIDNHNPPIRTGQTPGRDEAQKVKGANQPPRTTDAEPAARTHLSHGAPDASQDIDTARVAEIREAIREGKLEIHAERIADGLIANVRELLGQDKA
ncbi:MAG: flagellar biosynthesis anti-sigma factor FlgM [Halomonas sp.]|uniref:flagellar biosynthesis anti-sigma factor FlgM n=1 Tax=Halomonas sp. TaxID=1486246 RepID=UPI0019D9BA37|nr:flagellar biosynthesis anti-sigma factor FlgM [Halomonas sp.]MBE0490271.1 flagellar biosynthesis anti-sigma factor FlgM [Halomonas sp.]